VQRERLMIDTFVELADTLAGDYDVADFLDRLIDRCLVLLEADVAGVLLESPAGDLRLAAGTSEEMKTIEQAELATGEGPCVQAYRTREAVIAPDISAERDRWPDVAPRLLDLGMRSGHAFPLQLRDDCIGALNLYRREARPFEATAISLAQALADVAAIGILQERKSRAAEERSAQLQHALDSRIVIEQAKGVLAERHAVSPQRAFEVLRAYARDHNLKLRDVSDRILAGNASDSPPDR
jgi:GAF domain-containing protein